MLEEHQAEEEALKALSAPEQKFYESERAILTTRRKALRCLFLSVAELDDFKQSFQHSTNSEAWAPGKASSSGGPSKIAHNVGSGPPCELYLDLKTYQD